MWCRLNLGHWKLDVLENEASRGRSTHLLHCINISTSVSDLGVTALNTVHYLVYLILLFLSLLNTNWNCKYINNKSKSNVNTAIFSLHRNKRCFSCDIIIALLKSCLPHWMQLLGKHIFPNELAADSWKLLALAVWTLFHRRKYTKNLTVIALVARRFPQLPVLTWCCLQTLANY